MVLDLDQDSISEQKSQTLSLAGRVALSGKSLNPFLYTSMCLCIMGDNILLKEYFKEIN